MNLNQLRIFQSVFKSASMTLAAKELHMTQSGVSQHVKTLEETVGVKLFDRVKQRLVPTAAASVLYRSCSESLDGLELCLGTISGASKELTGTVTIGTPIEFGNNVILPAISKFVKKHPAVKFQFRLDFASAMNEALLKGEMDFAFIDEFPVDRRIRKEKVYDETLELCISEELLRKAGSVRHARDFYESLDYIEYQEGTPILRLWFDHHLDSKHIKLNVRTTVMDVQGVARLIEGQVGAGVLPGHLCSELQGRGWKIHRFRGCGKPVKNSISLAYVADRTQSRAAAAALDWLKTSLAKDRA